MKLEEQKISQRELSNMTGISVASINRYLNGILEPNDYAINKIAKAIGVSYEYLVGEETNLKQVDRYKETYDILTRNRNLLTAEEKLKLIDILIKEMKVNDKK